MTLIELDEYGTAEVDLSREQAAALQAAAGDALTITPSHRGAISRVVASSYVGTVVATGVEVRIRPKVPVDNVLFLLTAGWRRDWLSPETVRYERSEVTPAFVALFAGAVTVLLRRGEQQDYVEMTDDLDTIRGRIDLSGQFRRPGLLVPVTCRFSEFTADTPQNRYLKHAIRLGLRVPGVWPSTRRQLRHALASLDRVNDLAPPAELPQQLRYTRLNRAYEPVLRLAYLLRRGVGLSDRWGETTGASFLLNMNEVFERFVESGLRRALIGDLTVEGQHVDRLDVDGLVPIRPDLVFRDASGRILYVGDAKYKLSSNGLGRAGDYYQLHAYCTRFGLTDGVLVYATDDSDEAWPRRVVTTGDQITLRTARLPLMGTQGEIREAVDELGRRIRGWAHVAAPGSAKSPTLAELADGRSLTRSL